MTQRQRIFTWGIRFVGVLGAYYLGGRIGLAVPFVGSHISLIWPPTGIALAALLRWELSLWPAVWLGAFAVNLAVGSPPLLAAGIACGNTLGPLLAAWQLRRGDFDPSMPRRRDLSRYVAIGVLGGMAINATNGVLQLMLAGLLAPAGALEAWTVWWLGDAMGALILGIPLLTATGPNWNALAHARQRLELGSVLLLTLAVGAWALWGHGVYIPANPLLYLPFFLLSWLAIRGGAGIASTAALLLAAEAVWVTARSGGPFQSVDMHASLAMLWGYTATATVITVLITILVGELRSSERHLTVAALGGQMVLWEWYIPSDKVTYSGDFQRAMGIDLGSLKADLASFMALVLPEDRANVERELAALLQGDTSFQQSGFRIRIGARTVWIQARCEIVERNAKGTPVRMAGTLFNIDDRKASEAALKTASRKYRVLLHASSDGIHILDERGCVQEVSNSFCAMLGYPRKALLGMNISEWDAQWESTQLAAKLEELFETPATFETRLRRADGEIREIEISAVGVLLEGRRLLYCAARDITERKSAERRLARTEDNLRRAQRVAQVGSWHLDIASATLEWSEESYRIFGIQPGRPISFATFLTCVHPDDRAALDSAWQAALEGAPYDIQHRILVDGQLKWVREQAQISCDAEGRPCEGIGTVQDVSETKRREHELRESRIRMQVLLDASTESVILLGLDGRVLTVNTAGARRFGLTPRDMIGRDFYALLSPEVAARRRLVIEETASRGEPLQLRDQRQAYHFESSLYPIQDEDGKVESVAIYAKDVTQAARIEQIENIFRDLDAAMLRWRIDVGAVAQRFCERILPVFDLSAAWIGREEHDGRLSVLAKAEEAGSHMLEFETMDDPLCHGRFDACAPIAAMIQSGQRQRYAAGEARCTGCSLANGALNSRHRLLQPLRLRGATWGVMVLYGHTQGHFDLMEPYFDTISNRLVAALESAQQQEWLTLLDTALANVGNAVLVTDPEAHILWGNHAVSELTGYAQDEMLGRTPDLFRSAEPGSSFYPDLWSTLKAGRPWRGEVVNARRDGSLYTTSQTVTPLLNANHEISHFIAIIEDVSVRKEMEEHIRHAASYDALTDLPNRSLFFDRLAQALALAQRDAKVGALLFLDLDRFKEVNDRHGHAAGDHLLVQVAQRLRAQVRASDTVARLAGDEFTVILQQLSAPADALMVAEKIRSALAQAIEFQGAPLPVGVSIGIALFPAHGRDPEQILNAADHAMYQAKQAGRNAIRAFDAASTADLPA